MYSTSQRVINENWIQTIVSPKKLVFRKKIVRFVDRQHVCIKNVISVKNCRSHWNNSSQDCCEARMKKKAPSWRERLQNKRDRWAKKKDGDRPILRRTKVSVASMWNWFGRMWRARALTRDRTCYTRIHTALKIPARQTRRDARNDEDGLPYTNLTLRARNLARGGTYF